MRCNNCGAPLSSSLCNYCGVNAMKDTEKTRTSSLAEEIFSPNEIRPVDLIPDWEMIDTITI